MRIPSRTNYRCCALLFSIDSDVRDGNSSSLSRRVLAAHRSRGTGERVAESPAFGLGDVYLQAQRFDHDSPRQDRVHVQVSGSVARRKRMPYSARRLSGGGGGGGEGGGEGGGGGGEGGKVGFDLVRETDT